jgi:hypothetical protein
MLGELCELAGLIPGRVSYCSGVLSRRVTFLLRIFSKIHPLFGYAITLPLRPLPPLLDKLATPIFGGNHSSICLEAYKPRYGMNGNNKMDK